mmetsp:Transcript_5011/g.11682  ORF Transcript_5011/g.11682 Transcript_5011/m.11682 type:complete len:257 (-) Transcript_5011:212-982(-)
MERETGSSSRDSGDTVRVVAPPASAVAAASVESPSTSSLAWRNLSAAVHLALSIVNLLWINATGRVMHGHAVGAGPATCRVWTALRVGSCRNVPAAAMLAEAGANFRGVDRSTSEVMPETHNAATAASRKRPSARCHTWGHRTAAAHLAEAFLDLLITARLLQAGKAFLPGCPAKLVLLLALHPVLLLIHPAEEPAVLLAHSCYSSCHLRVCSVPCCSDHPLDVRIPSDLAVVLCLLVFKALFVYLVRVPKYSRIR